MKEEGWEGVGGNGVGGGGGRRDNVGACRPGGANETKVVQQHA